MVKAPHGAQIKIKNKRRTHREAASAVAVSAVVVSAVGVSAFGVSPIWGIPPYQK